MTLENTTSRTLYHKAKMHTAAHKLRPVAM